MPLGSKDPFCIYNHSLHDLIQTLSTIYILTTPKLIFPARTCLLNSRFGALLSMKVLAGTSRHLASRWDSSTMLGLLWSSPWDRAEAYTRGQQTS